MRTEETIGMVKDALKVQIPLFAFALLMCGLSFVVCTVFNLPVITQEQLQTFNVGAVYFNPGMIVTGVFAVVGFTPLLFYVIKVTFLSKDETQGENKQ